MIDGSSQSEEAQPFATIGSFHVWPISASSFERPNAKERVADPVDHHVAVQVLEPIDASVQLLVESLQLVSHP